jgi:hypothetical protein
MSVQNVQHHVNEMMHMFEHLAKTSTDIDAKQIIDDIHNEIGELPALENSWSVFARDINRTLDISAIVIKHAVLFVGYAKVYKVHNEFAEDFIKRINCVHDEINSIRNSKSLDDTI